AGMPATLKHFPGHGWVNADSHVALPVDDRSFAEIETTDLKPFAKYVKRAQLIMPAHVVYPQCDSLPAGFSTFWLKKQLREKLGFKGQIVSDDLCMVGAHSLGEVEDRAVAAIEAGCDLLLVCNRRDQVIRLLDAEIDSTNLIGDGNLSNLRGKVRSVGATIPVNPQVTLLEKQFAHYVDDAFYAQQKSIGESHA
ncbi:MAG: glycoside hydrolase family 3 N-terminal domain-containing protein, partial [Pseudomonadota bacterium]